MKKKAKERKEKQRKEKAKKRVLARREETRKEARWASRYEKSMKKFAIKPKPITTASLNLAMDQMNGLHGYEPVDHPDRVAAVKERLEHNMKILEELEKEYEAEQAQRKVLQEKMKEAGAETLREQMDLIGQKAQEIVENKAPQPKKLSGKCKARVVTKEDENKEPSVVNLTVESEEIKLSEPHKLDVEWSYEVGQDVRA